MDVGRFFSDEKYFNDQLDEIQMQAELQQISGMIPIVDVGPGIEPGFYKPGVPANVKTKRRAQNKRAKAARRRNR